MKLESPSHQFGNALIARLKTNANIAATVMEKIFSAPEQCQQIKVCADNNGYSIAVSIGNPTNQTADKKVQIPRFDCPVLIGVYAKREIAQIPDYESIDEYLHALCSEIIDTVGLWPSQANVPYDDMQILGMDDLDFSKLENLKSLQGKGVLVTVPLNYITTKQTIPGYVFNSPVH